MKKLLFILILSGCAIKPTIPAATPSQRRAVMEYMYHRNIQWLSADLNEMAD